MGGSRPRKRPGRRASRHLPCLLARCAVGRLPGPHRERCDWRHLTLERERRRVRFVTPRPLRPYTRLLLSPLTLLIAGGSDHQTDALPLVSRAHTDTSPGLMPQSPRLATCLFPGLTD